MPFQFKPSDSLFSIHRQWLHYHSKRSERLAKSPSISIEDGMATDFTSPILHDFEHLAMNRWGKQGPWVTEPRKYHEALADAFGNVARFHATHQRYPTSEEFIALFKQGERPEFHLGNTKTLHHHQVWVQHQHQQLMQSPAYQALPIVKKYRDNDTADAYRAFMSHHSFEALFPPPSSQTSEKSLRFNVLV
jgi:hypothetical protein